MQYVGGPPPPGAPPPPRSPWVGPPEDVVGAIVPMGQIVVRRRDLGLVLTHATVYPKGCHLHLEFVVQRDGAFGRVMGDRTHGRPTSPQTDTDELHFELRYPDGSVSSTRQLATARS